MIDIIFFIKIVLALFISLLTLKLVNSALKVFFKVILFVVIFVVIWQGLSQII